MKFQAGASADPIVWLPVELASGRREKEGEEMKTTTRGILIMAVLLLSCAAAVGATPSSAWTGTVASVSGDDLALVGIPVHFRLSGPVLEPMSGRAVRAGDLAAGSAVAVTAAEREVDGRLRATSVRVLSKNPFNLSGAVAKISDDRHHIEVEGVSIGVDDRTAFSGRNVSGSSIRSAGELRVGMAVRVTLTATSAGDLRATSLSAKETEPEPAEDQELKGTVDAVSDGEWKIGGRGFVIDENTVFIGDPGAGDFVEVRFHSDGQGHDVADRIQKEDAGDDEFELRGVVEAVGDASWTISGQVVLVNSATQIIGSPVVGDTVEAEGDRAGDGTLTARKIQKEDANDDGNDDHGGNGGGNDDPPGDDHGGNSGGDNSGGDNSGGDNGGSSGSGSHHGHGSDDPLGDD
jgi:hypothetical protein